MITFDNIDNVIAYAKKQLAKTDYAVLPDVYLINKDEFINYRSVLRQAIIYPNLTIQFPQEPKAIWNIN
jgi:hypothetical protein